MFGNISSILELTLRRSRFFQVLEAELFIDLGEGNASRRRKM
jgi:hypothetical protein